jgi:hypothetical protein
MQPGPFDAALAEAESCRLEARAAVEQTLDRQASLKDQPSGWCVVTRKGLRPYVYHNGYGKARLRDYLDRGHKVLLTVGIVARPDSPLNNETHLASVRVAQPGKLSDYKLHLISVRAKLHAARALFG